MGQNTYLFGQKKNQAHSRELWLHVLILLLSELVPSPLCVTVARFECA